MDFTAATPVDRQVKKVISRYHDQDFHNPGGLYREGVQAKEVVRKSRLVIANSIGAHADEIVFTSGATEADNLAVLGTVSNYDFVPHVVTTAIEHSGVRNTCKYLLDSGQITWTELPVDKDGLVDPAHLKKALTDKTVLVSIIYASNEIGVIQPVKDLMKVVRRHRKDSGNKYPFVHLDATQAFQYLDFKVDQLGVDLITFSAAKIYGPKGVGALYRRRHVPLQAIMHGGGQEFGLRPGTEAVSLIAGFAKAVQVNTSVQRSEFERLTNLRDYCIRKIQANFPKVIINGSLTQRLPNNISISVPGSSSELLVIELDARGVMCSARSACAFDDPDESYVIKALRQGDSPSDLYDQEMGSVRFSFGRTTTKKHIDFMLRQLNDVFIKYDLI